MKLDKKYVFHIPLSKYVNGDVIPIETEAIIDDLIEDFNRKGYENLYLVKAKGYYKSRSYDEVLITIFTSKSSKDGHAAPDEIFRNWFERNGNVLRQEALAYECNGKLFIENIF